MQIVVQQEVIEGKKRIIVQAIDTQGQEPIFDDEDEVDLQII